MKYGERHATLSCTKSLKPTPKKLKRGRFSLFNPGEPKHLVWYNLDPARPDAIRVSSRKAPDNFRVADYSGVDAIFVNTSAFLRTYPV